MSLEQRLRHADALAPGIPVKFRYPGVHDLLRQPRVHVDDNSMDTPIS